MVKGGMRGEDGVHGEGGCAWRRGVCMAKGAVHGEGGVHGLQPPPPGSVTTRYGRSMRGRYASYWNAFLFTLNSAKSLSRFDKASIEFKV